MNVLRHIMRNKRRKILKKFLIFLACLLFAFLWLLEHLDDNEYKTAWARDRVGEIRAEKEQEIENGN